jgi:hypothetical protein
VVWHCLYESKKVDELPRRKRRGIRPKGIEMKAKQLAILKFSSLLFLLPGLAGLIIAAAISTSYLDRLPRLPKPDEMRMTPRGIHGIVVYQTVEEDRRLSLIENTSVGIFLVGLGLGLAYLEQWGGARARAAEDAGELSEYYR